MMTVFRSATTAAPINSPKFASSDSGDSSFQSNKPKSANQLSLALAAQQKVQKPNYTAPLQKLFSSLF